MSEAHFFQGAAADRVVRQGRVVLSGLFILGAALRAWHPWGVVVDWQTLLFLVAAAIVLMLPFLSKIGFGKDGGALEFGTPADKAAVEKFGVGGKTEAGDLLAGSSTAADPQKGRWGGQSVAGAYALTARVDPIANSPEWFRVRLSVREREAGNGGGERARFHLHPSFRRTDATARFNEDVAELDLVAWGAFTVGAEVLDAQGSRIAELELDLAALEDAPDKFRRR